ncbi:hypothetical protein PS833_06515 [Pseudomonas fluorescens]|uniref:Uncharacterized protein n=1 Tax=Pseudomonas fluorescens TaxID=294 RepID=A0A5E7FZR7_PSEFL|nr:hypothetical protein PS833_06515 [Pseudomonas fluorescens]
MVLLNLIQRVSLTDISRRLRDHLLIYEIRRSC